MFRETSYTARQMTMSHNPATIEQLKDSFRAVNQAFAYPGAQKSSDICCSGKEEGRQGLKALQKTVVTIRNPFPDPEEESCMVLLAFLLRTRFKKNKQNERTLFVRQNPLTHHSSDITSRNRDSVPHG